MGQYLTRAPLRGPAPRGCPLRSPIVNVPPGATVTAWPKGGRVPGALRSAGTREGQGPTSQMAVRTTAAPALFPASTNASQTKSLFFCQF